MLAVLTEIFRDPVIQRVGVGWLAFVTLDRLNAIVGLMVGLATLVYLCLRIRDTLRRRQDSARSDD